MIKAFILGCPFAATIDKARVFCKNLKHGILDDFKTEQQLEKNLITIHDLLKKMNYSKLADFAVADIIRDDKFLLGVNEGKIHLANLIADLKNDLQKDLEHAKKVLTADVIKHLKHRLKGLFILLFSFVYS